MRVYKQEICEREWRTDKVLLDYDEESNGHSKNMFPCQKRHLLYTYNTIKFAERLNIICIHNPFDAIGHCGSST